MFVRVVLNLQYPENGQNETTMIVFYILQLASRLKERCQQTNPGMWAKGFYN